MTPLAPDETLVFIHTPKCGGSSVRTALRRWLGADVLFIDTHDQAVLEQALNARPRAVAGHIHWGACEAAGLKTRNVALVRDPVERFVSDYLHARATPDNPLHRPASDMDLEGFFQFSLADPRARRRTVGVQCYFLAAERSFAAAREAVDRYSLIAPTERLDAFIAGCAALLDRPAIEAPRRNVRARDGDIAAATALIAERLRQEHAEDQRLYEHVSART